MLDWIESVLWFINAVWQVIIRSLQLDPTLLQVAETYRESTWIIVTVAVLAGISQLLGQSVTLFVNRVPPVRFIASLLVNGVVFAVGLIVWAMTIWVVARYVFEVRQPPAVVFRMVALGSAPFVFGFLVLIPYMGPFIGRVLSVWSFLIVLGAIGFTFKVSLWSALIVVGAGWLLMQLLSATIGKPVVALYNWIWHGVVGSRLDTNLHDILASFAREQPDPPSGTGGKP